jgi:hypothetical protein
MRRSESGDYLSRWGQSDLFGLLTLLVFWAVLGRRGWYRWDLPWGDGAAYFARARWVTTDFLFPAFEWAPAQAGYYALFHLLLRETSPFVIYFIYRVVTLALLIVLMYGFLRRLLPLAIAWLLTVYALFLIFTINDAFTVHFFVLIPLVAACLLALSTLTYRRGLIGVCLLWAAAVRFELILVIIAVLCGIIYREGFARKPDALNRKQRLLLYTALCILLLSVIFFWTAFERERPRSWMAFGQHYAQNYRGNIPVWDVHKLSGWLDITEHSFGESGSIGQAAQTNPAAFARQLWWNGLRLPLAVSETFLPKARLPGPQRQAVGLLLLLLWWVNGRFLWENRADWLPRLPAGRFMLGVILGATAVTVLVVMLLIQPRPRHMLLLLPHFLFMMGLGLVLLLQKRGIDNSELAWTLPLLFILFLLIFLTPPRQPSNRQVLALVQTLSLIEPADPYGLLASPAAGACAYLGSAQCRPVEIRHLPRDERPFEDSINAHNIQIILGTPWLSQNLPPNGRLYLAQLQTDPQAVGWRHVETRGPFEIYVRQ